MKKIALLACQQVRSKNLCPADAKCLIAFTRREGEFERYKGQDAAIFGIAECGECEGNRNRALLSIALLKMQLAAMNENIDAIHFGTCIINFCPKRDDMIKALREKAGVEIVEGGHPYIPTKIFNCDTDSSLNYK